VTDFGDPPRLRGEIRFGFDASCTLSLERVV
jgi:hypothetical protein